MFKPNVKLLIKLIVYLIKTEIYKSNTKVGESV